MSRVPYAFTAIRTDDDDSGKNVVPYATVNAKDEAGAPANIYTTQTGGTPSSSFVLDANGSRQIWVEPGIYQFSVAGGEYFYIFASSSSAEDFTSEEKSKLSGIEDGATANSTDAEIIDASVEAASELDIKVIQSIDVNNFAYIEVDESNRPVRGLTVEGRYMQASEGKFQNIFGGPEQNRAVPLIENWFELTLDVEGRPVWGRKIDGSEYSAVNGVMTLVSANGASSLPASISAYGDSTTYGDDLNDEIGTGWEDYRWTKLLSDELSLPIENRGVNGQRVEAIGARSSGIATTAKPTAATIPSSGTVVLTDFLPGDFAGPNGFATLVDLIVDDGTAVRGTITYSSSGPTHTFSRAEAGDEIECEVVDIVSVQGVSDMSSHLMLGAGINNESRVVAGTQTISQIKGWYRAITSRARAGFTVWGLLDRGVSEAAGTAIGDYIRAIEDWLRETYGDDFADVRGYLSSQRALDDAVVIDPSFSPTAGDDAAVAANTVPPSFRSSGGSVHLNSRGHALQARFFARYFRRRFSTYQEN